MDEAETRRAPATKPALVPLRFEVMYRFHMLLSYTSGLVPLDLYLEKSTWFWVQSFNPSVQQTAGWILSVCARRPSSAMREVNASPFVRFFYIPRLDARRTGYVADCTVSTGSIRQLVKGDS